MQRSLLNKLGTILNTVGSLGTGYYAAKFNIVLEPTVVSVLPPEDLSKLIGTALLLVIGLTLRVRDLRARSHEETVREQEFLREKTKLVHVLDDLEDEHEEKQKHLISELENTQNRLADVEGLLETVVERVVDRKLAHESLVKGE